MKSMMRIFGREYIRLPLSSYIKMCMYEVKLFLFMYMYPDRQIDGVTYMYNLQRKIHEESKWNGG